MAFRVLPSTHTFTGEMTGYGVYNASEHLQTVNFTVEGQTTGGDCWYAVTLSAEQSGNFMNRALVRGDHKLHYNVYTASNKANILKEPPHATEHQVIRGHFPSQEGKPQTAAHHYYWTITGDLNLTLTAFAREDNGSVSSSHQDFSVHVMAAQNNAPADPGSSWLTGDAGANAPPVAENIFTDAGSVSAAVETTTHYDIAFQNHGSG